MSQKRYLKSFQIDNLEKMKLQKNFLLKLKNFNFKLTYS